MKTFVAPLNWGLGHASRCIPIIRRLLTEGHEVVIGGDGDSLTLLRQHFPDLRTIGLASLELRYSAGKSQVWAMARSFPNILRWVVADHKRMVEIQRTEHFERIISDNRFGLWVDDVDVQTIYMTHQVHVCLPQGWRWAETIASRVHALAYKKYKELWIPDYAAEEESLSGCLGHDFSHFSNFPTFQVRYLGPLSRFEGLLPCNILSDFDVVAVLSGLEPQRSILERDIEQRYLGTAEKVLIVQGKVTQLYGKFSQQNITCVPHLEDNMLLKHLLGCKKIIVRSGYSSVMDMAYLKLMDKVEWIPTPGQPEQEYLYELRRKK